METGTIELSDLFKEPFVVTEAAGDSMCPVILPGDRIVIDTSEREGLAAGDIIAYRRGHELICHRIKDVLAEKEGTFFVTKGDFNARVDREKITGERITGKVYCVLRDGRPIDPYALPEGFFRRASMRARHACLRIVFRVRTFLRDLWLPVQLHPLYGNTLGRWIFRRNERRIRYYLSVPCPGAAGQASRYSDIDLGHLLNEGGDFLSALQKTESFKIKAEIGGRDVACFDAQKLPLGSPETKFWALTGFKIRSFWTGTGIEKKLFDNYVLILKKMNAAFAYTGNGQGSLRPPGKTA